MGCRTACCHGDELQKIAYQSLWFCIVRVFPCASMAIKRYLSHVSRHHYHIPALQNNVLLQILTLLDISIAEGNRPLRAILPP
jgi:hypothetical protein